MKFFALFMSTLLGVMAAQASTLVPDYKIDCDETSMTLTYKSVVREELENGQNVLQVRDMHLNQIQNQKSYLLTIGGMDQDGNQVLQAEEISFDMGLRHERAILTLSLQSGYREGLLNIYAVVGDKVSELKSQHRLVCK